MPIHLISADRDFYPLDKVVSIRFIHGKVTLSPFVINKYFVWRYLETINRSLFFFIILLPTNSSTHQCFLPATVTVRLVLVTQSCLTL